MWRELEERQWGDVTNIHYKSNRNCHYYPLLYNEYIVIKKFDKKNQDELISNKRKEATFKK
jgi:hypothetical protein